MPPAPLLDPARRPGAARRGLARCLPGWRPALFALVALLYIAASAGPALFDQNEAQYAGAAREMLERPGDYLPSARGQLARGQWLTPTNDGIPRLQKPPLVYWLLMGSMRLFGVNEFGARLPNALAVLAWIAGTALLGRRLGGAALGTAAGLILATMAGVFIFGRLIAPEPFLAAWLTFTFLCLVAGCQAPEKAAGWMRLAWVFMALGCLSKGLHGALYPLAAAGLVAGRQPGARAALRALARPAGPLLFGGLVAPWYLAMEHRYPGFLWDQLVNEQWGHVINHRFPRDSVTVPLGTFCAQHLVFFLPWTFFLPAALAWSRGDHPPAAAGDAGPAGRALMIAWAGVTAGSLLFSSLQDYYLLTAWGPVALWLARPWSGAAGDLERLPRWTRLFPGAAFALGGTLALGAAAWLQWGGAEGGGADHLTPGRDNMLAVVTGFAPATWHRLLPLLWAAGGGLLAGGAANLSVAGQGRFGRALPVTAVMAAGLLALAAGGLTVLEDYFSLKQTARAIVARRHPGALVVCQGLPSDAPSLLFYLDRPVCWVGANPEMEFATRKLGLGRGLYLSEAEFARAWHSGRETFLIAEDDTLGAWTARLGLTPAQRTPVARSGTRVALVNGR